MTFIQSGSGKAARTEVKLKSPLDVRDFGAKGNGLDDDREAFRNAIEYVSSHGGGPLNVPPGMYRLYKSPWWWRAFRFVQQRLLFYWWYGHFPRKFKPDQSDSASQKD